ncbi:hypothetical protein KUCAC02_036643, partial [Chaenocephalus aceratus]
MVTVVTLQVEALQAEISELAKRLRYEVSVRARERSWTEKQSRFQFKKNLRRIVSQLYVRENCHPFKASLLIWVQLPLWISLSLALRNLTLDQSGKPDPDQPGKPDPDQSGKPDPDQPGKPDPDQPGKPDPDQPGKPDPDQPGKPDPDQPGKPDPDQQVNQILISQLCMLAWQQGGALWFPDLTVPDSTWILPLSLGLTNLIIVE